MLEMKLDEASLASARYLLTEAPVCDTEENTVERIGTRFDADSAKWLSEQSKSSLDQAIIEVSATSGLPEAHARTALLESTDLQSTDHAGIEPDLDAERPGPFYIDAAPLLEVRANEARAKQRAYELSKLLAAGEATVLDPAGEEIALYNRGALYNPATGEQLTPAI